MFDDKSILITGGTGSFGRQFVEDAARALQAAPGRRLFARRAQAVRDAAGLSPTTACGYFIGDVRDRERLVQAMSGVDFVIHAAALKQVPAAEYNPMECIKTNIHGAENVIAGRARQRRREGDRALDRQGRQPDQPLRRDQTRVGQAVRRGEQPCGRPQDAVRGRALRQRRRLARLGRAVLPPADRGGLRSPADHRSQDDPLLDHAAAGRGLRREELRAHARRRDLRAENPVGARRRPRVGARARHAPADRRHPARREAARSDVPRRRFAPDARVRRPLRHQAVDPVLGHRRLLRQPSRRARAGRWRRASSTTRAAIRTS